MSKSGPSRAASIDSNQRRALAAVIIRGDSPPQSKTNRSSEGAKECSPARKRRVESQREDKPPKGGRGKIKARGSGRRSHCSTARSKPTWTNASASAQKQRPHVSP